MLRHFADIERNTPTTDDDTGQPLESWAAVVEDVPCSVETVRGGEMRRGRQMAATTTLLVRMHFHQDDFTITPLDRIAVDGHTLGIVAAYDPDGMRRELHIECRENA
jgi:SPP1 family predicted phage head-tail adaptor